MFKTPLRAVVRESPKVFRYSTCMEAIIVVRSDVLLLWQNSECNETFGTTLETLLHKEIKCKKLHIFADGLI